MDRGRPEDFLQQLKAAEQADGQPGRGRLKIFFGYAAGVGKTYAMLEAAHEAKKAGIDVVCGYIEPHQRPATTGLLDGLEVLPLKKGIYHGIELSELDVDGVLERRPRLVLVDELAHTNAGFCRHQKRMQDIEELLRAGINVYTSVNVQHIESLNDKVAAITGVIVRERIPDEIFDQADQVELVDIEPEELLERLQAGKIYRNPEQAMQGFFSKENLTALREVALRRMAERVSHRESSRQVPIDEHILIGLSSSPTNANVIRTAARLATAFNGRFTALFVEPPGYANMLPEDKARLAENTRLAQSLGAKVATAYGEDVAWQIAEYVKQAKVSKVVLGRSTTKKPFWSRSRTFSERLIELVPRLDIYVIPDSNSTEYVPDRHLKGRQEFFGQRVKDMAIVAASLLACTGLGMGLRSLDMNVESVLLLYILVSLAPALLTSSWVYSLFVSVGSVLLFNFMFSEPLYTFEVYDAGYPVTFAVLFIVSLTVGFLTRKVKRQAELASRKAYSMEILLETASLLQQAEDVAGIYRVTAKQLNRLLDKPVLIYPQDNFQPVYVEGIDTDNGAWEKQRIYEELTARDEQAVAAWVLRNNKHAGAGTGTLPGSKCLYLAIRSGSRVMGVVGVGLYDARLESFENNMLISILSSCAMALEKERQRTKRRNVEVKARQEELRSSLLRGISHDLRTPLTTIMGNAELLQQDGFGLDEAKKQEVCRDIADDAGWLISMVENLLAVTRIQGGTMQIRQEPEVLSDIVQAAISHSGKRLAAHPVKVELADEYMMVKADSRLIIQVLMNLLDNAVKYTPAGGAIRISAVEKEDWVQIDVSDSGPGVDDKLKATIFDSFVTGKAYRADSRRGLGIGLSLCRAIVEAHGGRIEVLDNTPCGAVFRFTLPLVELG